MNQTVNGKKEKKQRLKRTLMSMKQGYYSEVNKAEAALRKAQLFENEANFHEYRQEVGRLTQRVSAGRVQVCGEIVKIFHEIDKVGVTDAARKGGAPGQGVQGSHEDELRGGGEAPPDAERAGRRS